MLHCLLEQLVVHQRLPSIFHFLLQSFQVYTKYNLSGEPMTQVKAMELIDQLEPTRRGPYSGGFGVISFLGDMDIALALRTIVFLSNNTMYSYDDTKKRRREWIAHLQSGAGIVADSDPQNEQIECENKAAGLVRAIDLAESAFIKDTLESLTRINGSFSKQLFNSSLID